MLALEIAMNYCDRMIRSEEFLKKPVPVTTYLTVLDGWMAETDGIMPFTLEERASLAMSYAKSDFSQAVMKRVVKQLQAVMDDLPEQPGVASAESWPSTSTASETPPLEDQSGDRSSDRDPTDLPGPRIIPNDYFSSGTGAYSFDPDCWLGPGYDD